MAGGIYGYSEGLGDNGVPDNWAQHNSLPAHFRQGSDPAGRYQVDQRPSQMRGGFYPSWMNMDNALGDLNRPVLIVERSLGEIIKRKFWSNPYLVMGVGVIAGTLVLKFILGSKRRR